MKISLFIIGLIACLLFYFFKRKEKDIESFINQDEEDIEEEFFLSNDYDNSSLEIYFEKEEIGNIDKLIEIEDEKTKASISNIVANVTRRVGNEAIKSANLKQLQNETLYKVIIPKGESLVKSKSGGNFVRGFYRGQNNITGHANLQEVKIDIYKNNINVASFMAGLSIIVGQYYMSVINKKLNIINEGIESIKSFLDNEYKGKIYLIYDTIRFIINNKEEIINNEELKRSEIYHIQDMEDKAKELLGQSISTINEIITKQDINFEKYKKLTNEIQIQINYQNIILELIRVLAELKMALYGGKASLQYCNNHIDHARKDVENLANKLKNWHSMQCKALNIDFEKMHRKREGNKVVNKVLKRVSKKLYYIKIDEDFKNVIISQIDEPVIPESVQTVDNTKILYLEEKYYYVEE
ncbi:MAG: hypothetical protein GYA87_01180 [Christensenellaceae bacterium]|nr:hypothetical protein [Christensenellaceae bacterium]